MNKKSKKFTKKHPVWTGIIIFLVFVFIINLFSSNNQEQPKENKLIKELKISTEDDFSMTNKLHWDHMPLTYIIKDNANCGDLQINKMLEALEILENKTSYVKFIKSNSSSADLIIQCVDVGAVQESYFEEIERLKKDKLNCIEKSYNYKKDSISTYTEGILNKSEQLFINASKKKYLDSNTIWVICYINISDISYENIENYGIDDWKDISNTVLGDARQITEGNIITGGKINLYKPENGWSVCTDFPAKEMHELLHILGFGHVEEPYFDPYYGYVDLEPVKDIMFPYSYCTLQKTIQQKYISCLNYIYSNGKIGFCSEEVNFLNSGILCFYGWYPTRDNQDCCPEPNMEFVNGYCRY